MKRNELGPAASAVYDRCRSMGLSEAAAMGAAAAEQQTANGAAVSEHQLDVLIGEAFGRAPGRPADHRTVPAESGDGELDAAIGRAFGRAGGA